MASTCLLSPFPFAGVPVVAGETALDHFVAPAVARDDGGCQVPDAKAKRAKRHHNDDLQPQLAHDASFRAFSTAPGSLAIFAAIRRASSRVTPMGAIRWHHFRGDVGVRI